MEQKKFTDVVRLGHKSTVDVLRTGDKIVIQEKIDGCFHYNSRVMLPNGEEKKIGEIVNKKEPIEVLSLNISTGIFESKKVTNFFNHGKKKPFIGVKISSTNGGRPNSIYCTPCHKFLTNKGWVEAQFLTEDLKLYAPYIHINKYQKQLLLGTAFGDSYIYPKKTDGNNRGIVYSTAVKFQDYKKLKDMVLGDLFSSDEDYISGYNSECIRTISKINLSTENVLSKCFIGEIKTMNEKYFSELDEIGLAFWYQDDGSLSSNKNQRDRARLNTQCLSYEENELLINLFDKYWNLKSSIVKEKKNNKEYYSINFDTESSYKLFKAIAPYVDKSMRYKLPNEFKDFICYWDTYQHKEESERKSIEVNFLGFRDVPSYAQNSNNYDIEVDDNHNYIVNGVVVHNSNASFTLNNGVLEAFSRNTKLNDSNTLGGYYSFVMESFNDKKNFLGEDYIYFGEWLNPHKVKYEGYEKQFFLFDIYSKSKYRYLDFKEVEHEAITLGLNLIPVFYQGEYESFEQLESYVGQTKVNGKIGDKQLGEGIVVKNIDYRDRFGNQMFVKLVVDEFREVQKQKKAKNPTEFMITPEYILAESLATKGRIDKIIYKLHDEGIIGSDIDKKEIGLIFKECNLRTYEDILKEESDSLVDINVEDFRKFTSNFAKKYAREHLMEVGAI